MEAEGQMDRDGFWAMVAEGEQRIRETFVEFPCFALTKWDGPVMVGEWIYDGGPHGLLHGDPGLGTRFAQVLTTTHGVNQSIRTMRLGSEGMMGDKETFQQRLDQLDRQEPRIEGIAVDNDRMDFALWQQGEKWWAGAERDGYGIVIEAALLDPAAVSLSSVTDIGPYLAAQRAWLRRIRGEG